MVLIELIEENLAIITGGKIEAGKSHIVLSMVNG